MVLWTTHVKVSAINANALFIIGLPDHYHIGKTFRILYLEYKVVL